MRGHARRAGKRASEALKELLLGEPSAAHARSTRTGALTGKGPGARPWSSASSSQQPPLPKTTKTTNSYNVSYASLALAGVTGAGLYYYFEKVKADRHARAALKGAQNAKVAGKADIGGPFTLVDSASNKPFSSEQLKGTWSLLYFGFTHCPDICPDELEKIASAIDMIEKESKGDVRITPVFITLDPERDGVKEVAPYVKEFHPRMIGLTGSKDDIMKVTKSYRVYFTKAGVGEMTGNEGNVSEDEYLIDHSIISYLLAPDGSFVTFFGKNYSDEEMAQSILNIVRTS